MDLIFSIFLSVPLFVFGYLYFQWRQRQNATLKQMIGGSVVICTYLAIVFNIVVLLVVYYQSTSVPGIDEAIFGKHPETDIVITAAVNTLLTAVFTTVAFIIGGFIQRAVARRKQTTTD